MSDAYGYTPGPPSARWQNVTNAVAIPSGWTNGSIDVTVRVVWERDGEEKLNGVATRWTADRVYVELADPRIGTTGIWVAPSDVVRR